MMHPYNDVEKRQPTEHEAERWQKAAPTDLGVKVAAAIVTENAADLFFSWLVNRGWTEPREHPPGVCQMCEFREALIDAIKAGAP